VIDISADYRYSSAGAYERCTSTRTAPVAHCAVHLRRAGASRTLRTPHVAHPGCFATAVLLSSVPLLQLGLIEPRLFLRGVTGSTARAARRRRHASPQRHSDLYAYNPLSHRTRPRITAVAQGRERVARNSTSCRIGAVRARHSRHRAGDARNARSRRPSCSKRLREFYRGPPFVRVAAEMPHVKDRRGSNYASQRRRQRHDDRGDVRHRQSRQGRAGGAMQWLNRVFGFEETAA
jgi:N-acetyl-gamma-glutamyl-phosphate reductase